MALGILIRTIWLALFAWYVVERLQVAKGLRREPPIWQHPLAAARRLWQALWSVPGLGWGMCAAVLGAQVVTCMARFLVGCAREGPPETLGHPGLQALFDVHAGDLGRLIALPHFWGLTWRELVDAVTLYPAAQAALSGPPAALLVGGFGLWAWRRRAALGAQKAPAWWYLAAGFVAFAAQVAIRASGGTPGAVVLPQVAATAILHGALLGLILLVCLRLSGEQGLEMSEVARDWLRLMPVLCLGGLAVALRPMLEAMLPGWEASRNLPNQGALAAIWLVTRGAWLFVLVMWLSALLPRRHGGHHGRDARATLVALALARGVVPLAPILLALALLKTYAPASGLFPGGITHMAQWLVGLWVMGTAVGTAVMSDER